MSEGWYYAYDNQSIGPLSEKELDRELGRFDQPRDILVWRKGMADWAEAGSQSDLLHLFEVPPPPPRRAPPPIPTQQPSRPVTFTADRQSVVAAPSQQASEQKGTLGKVGGWVVGLCGAIIGLAVGKAFGSIFWLPVILIAIVWYATRWTSIGPETKPVIVITGGHFLWMVVGLSLLASQGKLSDDHLLTLFVDVPLNISLLAWAIRKQSRAAVIGLMVYQGIALLIHLVTLSTEQTQTAYLLVHVLLRVVELGCGVYAIIKLSKAKSEYPHQLSNAR